jgi:dihydrofolate synthase/folylpolyglutamate synthase
VSGGKHSDPNSNPTYFDVMTALAYLHFDLERVDVAVIETGMGGRTDSTNVCRPRLSIITSISYDHVRQLGNTLRAIAEAKAGIVKPGRPTVSGVLPEEAQEVIAAACRDRGSPLKQLGADFTYRYVPGTVTRSTLTPSRVVVTTAARTWPVIDLNLLGEHQAANAAVVVAAVEQLREMGLSISDEVVIEALAQVQWPARIEIVRRVPLVVLDCAHNTASVDALVQTLLTSFPEYAGKKGHRALVFGASRDKDLAGMLTVLTPHFDRLYLTQYTSSSRCASTDALLGAARESGSRLPTVAVADPLRALRLAQAEAGDDDLICVTGSLFLAGELRASLIEL